LQRVLDAETPANRVAPPCPYFLPSEPDKPETACGGCQIHVLDRAAFKPVVTGVALIDEIRAAGPTDFSWRPPPYDTNTTRNRSTSWPVRPRYARQSMPACAPKNWRRSGR